MQLLAHKILLKQTTHGKRKDIRVRGGRGTGPLDTQFSATDIGRLESKFDGKARTRLATFQGGNSVNSRRKGLLVYIFLIV